MRFIYGILSGFLASSFYSPAASFTSSLSSSAVGSSSSSDSTSFFKKKYSVNKAPFSPEEFRDFTLVDSYDESPDTKVFRFALPEADAQCNLPCSSCIVLKYFDENEATGDGKKGKEVIRPYTPISRLNQVGYFDVMVKRYQNSHMGTHLFSMKRGEKIAVKGPFVKKAIKANQYNRIGMIAGGTGIAPMYQVLREVLETPQNSTAINLIYSSRRKEDVLLGNELNELMSLFPNKFSPYYVLSKPPSDWMGGIGHVSKEMIKSFMPPPQRAHDSVILVCGPTGLMESVCGDKNFKTSPPTQGELKGFLKEIGYSPSMIFKF